MLTPPIGWTILCASCGHTPGIGSCRRCGHEICTNCRHDTIADHCDGCGIDAESEARTAIWYERNPDSIYPPPLGWRP